MIACLLFLVLIPLFICVCIFCLYGFGRFGSFAFCLSLRSESFLLDKGVVAGEGSSSTRT
jgi:hypothetical protein